MKVDSVYIINLDRDQEKYAQVTSLFEKHYKIERVPAIDKDRMDRALYKQHCTTKCQWTCTRKMIAVALSHMRAWQTLLKNGDQYGIIVEDDCYVEPTIYDMIAKLQVNNDTKWDMIYLGCFACRNDIPPLYKPLAWFNGMSPDGGEQVTDMVHRPKFALGTHCYILSRQGALNLVRLFSGNIEDHVDVQIQKFAAQGHLRTLALDVTQAHQESSRATDMFPRALNMFLTQPVCENVSLAYFMSTPGGQLFGYEINAWLGFFIIAALICRRYRFRALPYLSILFAIDIYNGDVQRVLDVLVLFFIATRYD